MNYSSLLKNNTTHGFLILEPVNDKIADTKFKTIKEKNINEYYLFCGQLGNFQTRSILIPHKLLPENRKKEWDMIKSYKKNNTQIENLVVVNLIVDYENKKIKKVGFDPNDTELHRLCDVFMLYAEYSANDEFTNDGDEEWHTYSYGNLCDGSDHVKNYLDLLKLTEFNNKPIKIVDSILMLESNNKKFVY